MLLGSTTKHARLSSWNRIICYSSAGLLYDSVLPFFSSNFRVCVLRYTSHSCVCSFLGISLNTAVLSALLSLLVTGFPNTLSFSSVAATWFLLGCFESDKDFMDLFRVCILYLTSWLQPGGSYEV